MHRLKIVKSHKVLLELTQLIQLDSLQGMATLLIDLAIELNDLSMVLHSLFEVTHPYRQEHGPLKQVFPQLETVVALHVVIAMLLGDGLDVIAWVVLTLSFDL